MNGVVAVPVPQPVELLDFVQEIEQALGRQRDDHVVLVAVVDDYRLRLRVTDGLLRHGAMGVLFGGIRAPSTLGSFLRSFTWGNVLQLQKVLLQ